MFWLARCLKGEGSSVRKGVLIIVRDFQVFKERFFFFLNYDASENSWVPLKESRSILRGQNYKQNHRLEGL